MYKSIIGRRRR